jgi:hypothetical protein
MHKKTVPKDGDFVQLKNGWGARDRTWECRNQKPVPYRLATPQQLTLSSRVFSELEADTQEEKLILKGIIFLVAMAGIRMAARIAACGPIHDDVQPAGIAQPNHRVFIHVSQLKLHHIQKLWQAVQTIQDHGQIGHGFLLTDLRVPQHI